MDDRDPYTILGIGPDATPQDVRTAFRNAVRRKHPDTRPGGEDSAVRDVIDAYHLLSDPAARSRYDATHPIETEAGPSHVRREAVPPCPSCRGAGLVRAVVECPRCNGTAETTILDIGRIRILRCRTCWGGGQIRTTHTCEACGGSGTAMVH